MKNKIAHEKKHNNFATNILFLKYFYQFKPQLLLKDEKCQMQKVNIKGCRFAKPK